MNEPITTLDFRHSPPGAVVTPWEETRRVLETADLFWLSTVRAGGRPHVTPLVAVWHDGAIHFTATDTAQKTANLRGNPHVILTTGYNQTGGLSVVVEGDAVRITDQDTLERLASVWATKWDGESWLYQVCDGYFCLYDEDERVLVDSNLVFSVKAIRGGGGESCCCCCCCSTFLRYYLAQLLGWRQCAADACSRRSDVRWTDKAQSPYSVNMLATFGGSSSDSRSPDMSNYVKEVLAARETLYEGLRKLGIPSIPARRTSSCSAPAAAPFRFAMHCATVASWSATAATRYRAACVSLSAIARQIERFLARVGGPVDSVIVFDMDGVLAEVTESYRESIVQTVRYFTGKTVTRDAIQDYKNQGGWNNDWALSQKIAADFGTQIDYDTVIEKFNEYFLGENGNGLVTRESWFPQPGLLERLGERYGLSLFTGRLRYEADITLRRFAPCVEVRSHDLRR